MAWTCAALAAVQQVAIGAAADKGQNGLVLEIGRQLLRKEPKCERLILVCGVDAHEARALDEALKAQLQQRCWITLDKALGSLALAGQPTAGALALQRVEEIDTTELGPRNAWHHLF